MVAKKKVDTNALTEELGVLRDRKKAIEAREKVIVAELRGNVKPGTTVYSDHYQTEVVPNIRNVLVTAKVIRKIGQKEFNKIATVTLSALKKILSEQDISKLTTEKEGTPTVRSKIRAGKTTPTDSGYDIGEAEDI